ncbi:hypothetical protein LWI29_020307 [Acer saccharum]|uniref:DUF7138 domain-containing protein n=1 Tax=Acer saccharum TaxID=4024 RepID=A0AA39S3Y0_ACESA|nr:hypothetical protein LWI29_020307 [Acer saccharum]KAK1563943.1 hypothetical protein Q3G72_035617 [Acer saccharum]
METIFPVIFFDGDREINIGNVVVHPSLDYKSLQSTFSRKIGLSPNQFSVFLADRKTSRKIPITGKANFSAISREKDCLFLVVMRGSRDSRSRRQKRQPEQPVSDVMLLRRNIGFFVKDLEKGEKYLTKTGPGGGGGGQKEANGVVFACEHCVRDQQTGGAVGFHCCVNDTVITGFRSKAGPIARPVTRNLR